MSTLVVYFSKTGSTKKLADKIAKKLGADMDEIIDVAGDSDKKPFGKVSPEIKFKKDPSKYDLVVIGGPTWGFSATPIVKCYLTKNKFKEVAFFCTCGLWNGFLFSQMKKLSKEPRAKLKVKMKKVETCDDKVNEFCNKLNRK